MKLRNPLMLVILDGFGHRSARKDNAIALAKAPFISSLFKKYPNRYLAAAGEAVGLPRGFIGNSEVNHLNIGAGRIVYQDMTRISNAIKDGSFFRNRVLNRALRETKGTLHLMGLLSDGGVHSHITHLFAILKQAKKLNVRNICIHCFMDGRDTRTTSGIRYMGQLMDFIRKNRIDAKISTIMGRFYSMDRDRRWKREKKAYDCLVSLKGKMFADPIEAIQDSYNRGITDEFIEPGFIDGFRGIRDNDTIIFFNFRSDRARQLTHAFVDSRFDDFRRKKVDVEYYCMCEYDDKFRLPVIIPQIELRNTFSEFISKKGFRQLKIAETEKFVHVTFFFDGQRQKAWPGEDRIIIPSPKVTTYDQKPEMSAYLTTDRVIREIRKKRYDVIVMNYANADMVGHTGSLKAAIEAVETLDICLKKVVGEILSLDGTIIVTADHGNAEEMSGPHQTTHTMNDVPFILVSGRFSHKASLKKGGISDITPTMLHLMGLPKPKEMTGRSLL
ncbi:2,3-bisphosphoglycerate-independent phosphoglycerate mutase [Candidatus Woesearchaeota archaeon]|nr:2,3-bisphosphoglycerate-independent phosphoglycerate mutase [Candidatus Woesearchaeota archaeon]